MSDGRFAVRLEGVSKEFLRGGRRQTFFRMLRDLTNQRSQNGDRRRVLDGLDLEIPRGETVGIVGENGAGKTTLLKTIAGLYRQTAGTITTHGDVALLAGLGAGMVDELSVTDNVWLYGAVCRIRRSTIRDRFDAILRWADLGAFAAAELRTLSTGMRTRLAFAIAMEIESDTVLMDEAFSAGDKRFQEKCNEFFLTAQSARRTFLVATHNLEFVRQFCTSTLWMHAGRVRAFGPTPQVLDEYTRFEEK
jgi:ABC-type polysaccharide/polyol phosphate transport system ATPase subunit